MAVSHWKSNSESTWISSPLISTAVLVPIQITWFFHLNVYPSTCLPSILCEILSLTYLGLSKLTCSSTVTPFIIFLRLLSGLNGFLSASVASTSVVSWVSLSIWAYGVSLCCSQVSKDTPERLCIASLMAPHAGIERTHTSCWVSFIPQPWVRPPVIFKFVINTCSVTKLLDSPAQ